MSVCVRCGAHTNNGQRISHSGLGGGWSEFICSDCIREKKRLAARPKSAAELEKEARSNEAMAGCVAKVVVAGLVIGAIILAVNWIGTKIGAYNARKEQAAQVLREASEAVDGVIAEDEAEAKRRSNELRAALAREREERAARERAEAERREAEERRLAAEVAAASRAAEDETGRKERRAALIAFAKVEAPETWNAVEEARATASAQDGIASERLKEHDDCVEVAESDDAYLDALRRRNEAARRIRLCEKALDEAFKASVRLKSNPEDADAARARMEALARAAAVFEPKDASDQ